PFIGIGDPVLEGGGSQRGGMMVVAGGHRPGLEELRQMNRLPGTRAELVAVAQALGAEPRTALFLGDQATKATVRQLNSQRRLGQARVLAFATHGVLAGELGGLAEPALVLTPPATPTEEDDGLLRLEDVLGLTLPATDWVILSACNTGAGDGSGESLAGLARA